MDKINKVAIFGMGKSGKAAVKLAKKLGQDLCAVNSGPVESWYHAEKLDGLISSCQCYSEEDFAQHFHKMDEIVISPGIPATHSALKTARENGIKIISEIEYAWRNVKDIPVIAITGTNGKTTTATMITEALRKAGKKVFCGGNIGAPYCELPVSGEKVDYAVIEVSSFQLETIHDFRPKIGLLLNVFPNHSERYDKVHDYAAAKFRLLKNLSGEGHVILGTENPYLGDIENSLVKKHFFTKGNLPEEFLNRFSFAKTHVQGEHNESNFYAAFKVLELLGIEDLDTLFQEFINEFKGVAHRLEFVLEKKGLKIFNDAKSTNALATITAIKAFKENKGPLFLVLGGKLRNEADCLLPELLPFKGLITRIFTVGDVTERLYEELKDDFVVERCYEVKKVLEKARDEKLVGNLVFSPAFPSFDQFKNYVDRGDKFKSWALESFSDG